MDVSGIQKMQDEAYMAITGGAGYFANVEGKDCGVPTFPNIKTVDAESLLQSEDVAREIEHIANSTGIEMREIKDVVRYLADDIAYNARRFRYSAKEASEALARLMQGIEDLALVCMDMESYSTGGCAKPGKFIICRTAWDRMEEREKRRTAERETAARFRQRKVRESAWNAKKRTGKRGREWRGPWKESKSD